MVPFDGVAFGGHFGLDGFVLIECGLCGWFLSVLGLRIIRIRLGNNEEKEEEIHYVHTASKGSSSSQQ